MIKLIYFLFLLYYLPSQTVLADEIIKEQSLQTSYGKSLIVKSDCGGINITTWSKNEAYVKISGNDIAKNNFEFTIEEKNGDIYVIVKKPNGTKSLNDVRLNIEVSIPEQFNTDISTAGGNISLEKLEGTVDMSTAGGNIILKNISGKSDLKTAGGNITVESSSGNVEAKTAGGNIYIESSNGNVEAKTAGGDINIKSSNGNVEAKTAGGEITVNYTGENKGIELKTSGGNINLYLPGDFSANVNLKTSNGEIDMGFEYVGETNKSKTKITGKINGGGESVSCKTSGGNITLNKK